MQLSDFNYDLPPELIAQHPLANRSDSRLLEVAASGLGEGHNGVERLTLAAALCVVAGWGAVTSAGD